MTADAGLHEKDLVLEITRQFDVPREVLFRAWTDPSWLVRWMDRVNALARSLKPTR